MHHRVCLNISRATRLRPNIRVRIAGRRLLDRIPRQQKPTPLNAACARPRVAMARGWLLAQDTGRALDLAQRAHRADPGADGPALIAIELLPTNPAAETIVAELLAAKPNNSAVKWIFLMARSGRGKRRAGGGW